MQASSEQASRNEGADPRAASIPFYMKFLATGFYTGYSPIVPGTTGSMAGIAVYLIPSFEQAPIILLATVVAFFLGAYAGGKIEKAVGHDPSIVVIDEMVGMWISLFLLPKTVPVVLGAFVLFRILDTLKPQPARVFQRKGGGIAIMMDDVVSAVYTNLIVRLVIFVLSIV
jgi:phosphatidylglycerophosphatase A